MNEEPEEREREKHEQSSKVLIWRLNPGQGAGGSQTQEDLNRGGNDSLRWRSGANRNSHFIDNDLLVKTGHSLSAKRFGCFKETDKDDTI